MDCGKLLDVPSVRVVNEKERERRAPRGGVCGGVSLPLLGRGWRVGCAPSPEFFVVDFLSASGAFWCILGACFNVSIRRVTQS